MANQIDLNIKAGRAAFDTNKYKLIGLYTKILIKKTLYG
jgi:hypothetical protein